MPNYSDRLVVLLYCIWYHPSQVNLAYTLAQNVPKDKNPLLSGTPSLRVFDYGCGALAMQFGLTLAAIDLWERHKSVPKISVQSYDTSKEIIRIGQDIWHEFRTELDRDAQLDGPREVCSAINLEFQEIESDTSPIRYNTQESRWLTVLHVSYRKNTRLARKDLNSHIRCNRPDLVLVTFHPEAAEYSFCPNQPGYNLAHRFCYSGRSPGEHRLNMYGRLHKVSELRSRLEEYMKNLHIDDHEVGRKRDLILNNKHAPRPYRRIGQSVNWQGRTDAEAALYFDRR